MNPSLPGVGDRIGKFRVDRALGRGGMGVVFEATHVKLGQSVAIKMLLPEFVGRAENVARFEREARAAAKLRHRNAVRVMDVDQTDSGIPYFVMELLNGHDVEAELHARGPLPVGDAVQLLLQAAAAMAEAHQHGTVHRDLKPSNLFLNRESDGSVCLKVLDFGISKVAADSVNITSTEAQMGTPLYMSPEQVRSTKNVDHRTDIWSLGVILYELLAGAAPFQGSAAGIGAAIVSIDPKPLHTIRGDIPAALESVVARAMAKDPSKRFQSMTEFAQALAPFSSAPISMPSPMSTGPISKLEAAPTVASTPLDPRGTAGPWTDSKQAPSAPRRLVWIAVALLFLVPIAAATAWIILRPSPKPAAVIPAALPSATTSAIPSAVPTLAPLPSAPAASAKATSSVSARPTPKIVPTRNPDRL